MKLFYLLIYILFLVGCSSTSDLKCKPDIVGSYKQMISDPYSIKDSEFWIKCQYKFEE
jgi:hypothetical protein